MGLDEVRAAAERLVDAEEDRNRALREAVDQGVPISEAADAARVTRQTVYRIIGQWSRTGRPDALVLDAGIDALLETEMPPATWGELMKARRSTDVLVKARRIRLALSNIDPRSGRDLTTREVVQDAASVAGRLLARY